MGLFEGIRSRTNSVPAQIFFAIIVLVFVFWGVNGGGGAQRTTYATVNGERVNNAEVQLIARQQRNRGSQNEDEQKEIMKQIIESVILSKSVSQEASKEGFISSETELALHIASDENFRDNNEFSQERYLEQIQNMGFASEVKYEKRLAEFIKTDKHLALIAHSAFVSNEALLGMHVTLNTTKTLQWVRISEGAFFVKEDVSEEERNTIIETEQQRLNENYMANLNTKYSRPDTWHYQTVQIDGSWTTNGLEAPATDLLSTLQKSLEIEPLDSLLEKPPFQGYIKKGEEVSGTEAQLDPAIFTLIKPLAKGKSVLSTNGENLYLLTDMVPAFEKSFDDVKNELATEFVQQKKAATAAEAFAQKIHAEWKDTISQTLLDEKSLTLETSDPFTASTTETVLAPLATAGALLEDVKKATEIGTLAQSYKTPEGWVVARVNSIEAPTNDNFVQNKSQYELLIKMSMIQKYTQELNNNSTVERMYTQQ